MKKQNVVLVAGYAGSGKTTFSSMLVESLSENQEWTSVDKDIVCDTLTSELMGQSPEGSGNRESNFYLNKVRPMEYKIVNASMRGSLLAGVDGVVVTAPFVRELNDEKWLSDFREWCSTREIGLTFVWIDCSEKVLHERLSVRNFDRDQHKLTNWREWYNSIPPISGVDGMILVENNDFCEIKSIQSLNKTYGDMLVETCEALIPAVESVKDKVLVAPK